MPNLFNNIIVPILYNLWVLFKTIIVPGFGLVAVFMAAFHVKNGPHGYTRAIAWGVTAFFTLAGWAIYTWGIQKTMKWGDVDKPEWSSELILPENPIQKPVLHA